jgi:coproporphyrinogen III oxidase-like Fe-S oxidoreductase
MRDLRAQVGLFARYADAVCAEVGVRRGDVSSEVNTLYIGGGTPSVLPLSVLSRVVGAFRVLVLLMSLLWR